MPQSKHNKNLQKRSHNRPLTADQKALIDELGEMTIIDRRRLMSRIRGLENIKKRGSETSGHF